MQKTLFVKLKKINGISTSTIQNLRKNLGINIYKQKKLTISSRTYSNLKKYLRTKKISVLIKF